MPNILKIYVDALEGYIKTDALLLPQTLYLKYYRVEFTDDADAIAAKFINFSMDCLKSNKIKEGVNNGSAYTGDYSSITLALSSSKITCANCNIGYEISEPLNSTFQYKINSISTANFSNALLIFEYDSDSLN